MCLSVLVVGVLLHKLSRLSWQEICTVISIILLANTSACMVFVCLHAQGILAHSFENTSEKCMISTRSSSYKTVIYLPRATFLSFYTSSPILSRGALPPFYWLLAHIYMLVCGFIQICFEV